MKRRPEIQNLFLQLLIEKYTIYGIITIQLVDTGRTEGSVILTFSWENGAKTGCNMTEKELTDYEVHN